MYITNMRTICLCLAISSMLSTANGRLIVDPLRFRNQQLKAAIENEIRRILYESYNEKNDNSQNLGDDENYSKYIQGPASHNDVTSDLKKLNNQNTDAYKRQMWSQGWAAGGKRKRSYDVEDVDEAKRQMWSQGWAAGGKRAFNEEQLINSDDNLPEEYELENGNRLAIMKLLAEAINKKMQ